MVPSGPVVLECGSVEDQLDIVDLPPKPEISRAVAMMFVYSDAMNCSAGLGNDIEEHSCLNLGYLEQYLRYSTDCSSSLSSASSGKRATRARLCMS